MSKQMSKKAIIRLVAIIVASVLVVTAVVLSVVFCGNHRKRREYNNETDPLVFSTLELDKVFNPFFSTTGPDGSVVGMTQIGMISNDKDGNPTYGPDEPVITNDLLIKENKDAAGNVETTTYYFVLKNNVRFSDNVPLTIKDILFNLYVYLDPVYTGSSTIYSTDIVGLKEYRTQEASETEQDSADLKFKDEANNRIDSLVQTFINIKEDEDRKNAINDIDQLRIELQKEVDNDTTAEKVYKNLVNDFDLTETLYDDELNTDYSNSLNSYDQFTLKNKNGKAIKPFTTDVEMFLYNEGFITWNYSANNGEGSFEYAIGDALLNTWKDKEKSIRSNSDKTQAEKDKEALKKELVNHVKIANFPSKLNEILLYWGTSNTVRTEIANKAREEWFKDPEHVRFQNISGIKFLNKDEAVTIEGTAFGSTKVEEKTIAKPEYNADGSVKDGYNEVLSITINKVDPKAIWNFSLGIAPMHYYSDKEHVDAFDFESNFGVEYSSPTFMKTVVNSPDKVGLPVGAGMYAASKSDGGIENVKASDFYNSGVVYYERNPYFVLGPAKIKKVRYQVVSATQMLNSLYNEQIDFAEPNAKSDTIKELETKKKDGFTYANIRTAGYGYIGINAGKIASRNVRQAIMHTMDTSLCVKYYQTTATTLNRPISKASWAYPKNAIPYYPYIGGPIPNDFDTKAVNPAYRDYVQSVGKKAGDTLTEAEQKAFIKSLVEEDGYTLNANGVYQSESYESNQGATLKFTFTIAGAEQDHPAFDCMFQSSEFLNKIGFDTNVQPDVNALRKLNSGALTVWAAAWGSTIDPDMYQVYHKDSKATSVLNWGYDAILNSDRYDEQELIDNLSTLIEVARETNDVESRKVTYAEALDLVMELAVELPTYQRDDLFAYDGWKIDESTLTPKAERSPFNGLTNKLWKVGLVTKIK